MFYIDYAHHHNQHSVLAPDYAYHQHNDQIYQHHHIVLVPDYAGESNTVRGLSPSPRQLKTGSNHHHYRQ